MLSDNFLVIFDPHRVLFEHGGIRIDISQDGANYADHLSSFDHYATPPYLEPFNGTVIRLPLRSHPSRISSEVHSVDTIRQLLLSFIESELHLVMLYLKNIKSIEIREIDDRGDRLLGKADITRGAPRPDGEYHTYTSSVNLDRPLVNSSLVREDWLIVRGEYTSFQRDEVIIARLGSTGSNRERVSSVLNDEKLMAHVALAVPLPLRGSETHGRLFTYLPLPLQPGFPCHVHALYALTDSRQNLINPSEASVVTNSREESVVSRYDRDIGF